MPLTIDRSTPPPFKKPEKLNILQAQTYEFKNGVKYHEILSGTQEALRIEFIFKAGTLNEAQPGLAHFTNQLLTSGTTSLTASDIEHMVALRGAFLELNPGLDRGSLILYTLSKHIPDLLPIVLQIVSKAIIPEIELENQKSITKQNLKVNLEKTSYLASTNFRQNLFGPTHPYGRKLSEDLINSIDRKDIYNFYEENYNSDNLEIVLSGGGKSTYSKLFENYFGKEHWGKNSDTTIIPEIKPGKGAVAIKKEGALQTSIRVGFHAVKIDHPEYFSMALLNEIYGGYFGSRLMKNIREEKGYTYGIHSNIVSLEHGAYLVIGTDVNKENAQQTIDEIKREAERLQKEEVTADETNNVKNFMLGSFLNSLNTPFALADKFKTIHFNGLEYDFYEKYFDFLNTADSEVIYKAANDFFNIDRFLIVTAG